MTLLGTPPGAAIARRPVGRWGLTGLLALVVLWSLHGTGIGPGALASADAAGAQVLSGMLRPDLRPDVLADVVRGALQTVQVAVAGLALSVLLAAPVGLLLTAQARAARPLREAARAAAGLLRGIPELVWALLLVATVGLGPTAGACALGLHGAGLLGKLWAEQLDAVDPVPVEAVRLAGAGRTAVLALAVVPQAAAGLGSLLLYQLECNVRAATVLGVVGAGGLGGQIDLALRLFDHRRLGTLVLAVLVLVLGVDALSRAVRRRLGARWAP